MVFELTDTLIDNNVLNHKVFRDALHNLFLGYEEGNLILSLSPDLLDFLDKGLTDTLSKRVIYKLQHSVFAHYDVLWQTKVVLDNPDTNNHELPIDFFKNSSAIQPPILLCENLDDTKFYFALCEEYYGINYLNTRNGQGGGGSSTADNFEQIVNKRDKICLCIVDSDIKFPGSDDGGTYGAIRNKNIEPYPSHSVYKLQVHEIENLIPIEIIRKHVNDENNRHFCKLLKSIDKNGDILHYYDFKDGIKLSAIRKHPKYYTFAQGIYDKLNGTSTSVSFEDYLKSLERKKCDHVFAPLCPGILDKFLSLDIKYHERYIYCDYLRAEWDRIKQIMVTFFCARQDVPLI